MAFFLNFQYFHYRILKNPLKKEISFVGQVNHYWNVDHNAVSCV